MGLKVSKRGTIPPFIVMDVLRAANERAAAGHDVVHLEVGQPSTGAPSLVVEAAKAALDADTLGYTDALGLPELRRGIAEHYKHTYDIAVDADRVVLTVGSSGGVLLGFLSAFETGDRVALASPGYPAYRNILGALGVEVGHRGVRYGFHHHLCSLGRLLVRVKSGHQCWWWLSFQWF